MLGLTFRRKVKNYLFDDSACNQHEAQTSDHINVSRQSLRTVQAHRAPSYSDNQYFRYYVLIPIPGMATITYRMLTIYSLLILLLVCQHQLPSQVITWDDLKVLVAFLILLSKCKCNHTHHNFPSVFFLFFHLGA